MSRKRREFNQLESLMKLRKDTDVAWCAGFFDGEGCVKYYKSRNQLMATVAQISKNIEVLEHFQAIVGFGRILGPYDVPGSKNTKHTISYGINEVEPLFEILKPYLRKAKTRDFERAIARIDSFEDDEDESNDDAIKLDKAIWELLLKMR